MKQVEGMFWWKLDRRWVVFALLWGLCLPQRTLRVPEHQRTQFENHWSSLTGKGQTANSLHASRGEPRSLTPLSTSDAQGLQGNERVADSSLNSALFLFHHRQPFPIVLLERLLVVIFCSEWMLQLCR